MNRVIAILSTYFEERNGCKSEAVGPNKENGEEHKMVTRVVNSWSATTSAPGKVS